MEPRRHSLAKEKNNTRRLSINQQFFNGVCFVTILLLSFFILTLGFENIIDASYAIALSGFAISICILSGWLLIRHPRPAQAPLEQDPIYQDSPHQTHGHFLQGLSSGYVSIDLEDLAITEVNPALCTLLNCSADKIIGRSLASFLASFQGHTLERVETMLRKTLQRHHTFKRTPQQADMLLQTPASDTIAVRVEWGVDHGHLGKPKVFALITDLSPQNKQENTYQKKLQDHYHLLNSLPLGISLLEGRRFIQVNQSFCTLFNRSAEELIGQTTELLYEDRSAFDNFEDTVYSSLTEIGQTATVEVAMVRKTGEKLWIRETGTFLGFNGFGAPRFAWIAEDITETHKAAEQQRLATTVFNNSSQAIMVCSSDNLIETVNPTFTSITGYTADEVIGKPPTLLQSGRHDTAFYTHLWSHLHNEGSWRGEIWNRRRNGEIYAEWLSISTLRDAQGKIEKYIALFSDITERKQEEEQIRFQANYDALTHLPNRNLFYDRLHQIMTTTDRKLCLCGLLYIDLDGFKDVNDTLGHAAGDHLLKEGARRLRNCVRNSDTVARLGGDEFTIILSELHHRNDAFSVAQSVLKSFQVPFDLGDVSAQISMSIGIALYPLDTRDEEELIKYSDIAMYTAKKSGKNTIRYFDRSMLKQNIADIIPDISQEEGPENVLKLSPRG